MDNNIPPGVIDPAYEEEVKTKKCTAEGCREGKVNFEMFATEAICLVCKGTGEVAISFEEIVEEAERKRENQSNL